MAPNNQELDLGLPNRWQRLEYLSHSPAAFPGCTLAEVELDVGLELESGTPVWAAGRGLAQREQPVH